MYIVARCTVLTISEKEICLVRVIEPDTPVIQPVIRPVYGLRYSSSPLRIFYLFFAFTVLAVKFQFICIFLVLFPDICLMYSRL
jgi:hypothetical protein